MTLQIFRVEEIQLEVENLGAQTTYEIISLNGVKISQDRVQDRITTININNFPSGMYLLKSSGVGLQIVLAYLVKLSTTSFLTLRYALLACSYIAISFYFW
jgi:hypothetical protein